MAVFNTAEDLYGLIGAAFAEFLARDPAAGPFREMNAIVRFEFNEPDAQVTLSLEGEDTTVEFGASARVPNATATLAGDLAHQIMAKDLALAEALSRRDVSFSPDNPWLLIQIGPLPDAVRPTYVRLLEAAGRTDLIPRDVPVFGSDTEIYESFGRALRSFAERDPAVDRYLGVGAIVELSVSDPSATIVLDASGPVLEVHMGQPSQSADVGLAMNGNSLDRLTRGELQVTEAVGRSLLTYSGDTWKALEFLSLPQDVASYYEEIRPGGAASDAPSA